MKLIPIAPKVTNFASYPVLRTKQWVYGMVCRRLRGRQTHSTKVARQARVSERQVEWRATTTKKRQRT